MKIVQGAILVMIGVFGALLYVKVKSGPETAPTAAVLQQAAPQAPAATPEAPAPEVTPPEAPAPEPVKRTAPLKHHANVVRSNFAPPADPPQPVAPRAEPAPAPAEPVAPAPTPAPPTVEPEPVAPPAPEPAPPPRQATLSAGMLVPVRLQDMISSDRYHPGDTFTAVLDQPLVVDGLVIAEKGARVEGKVVESQRAGRVKGVASIALELTRVALSDGQHVEISTDSFTKMAPESHGADAAKIGGGAALGAIIGGIAGGGKGAAIGAGAGGAAGTGVVLGTRGKPAVLPSETKISFRLNQTVTVTERRRPS
jgi:hypothetical protein